MQARSRGNVQDRGAGLALDEFSRQVLRRAVAGGCVGELARFLRSHSSASLAVVAGKEGCTAQINGTEAAHASGVKSLAGSKLSLEYSAGFAAMGPSAPSSSV